MPRSMRVRAESGTYHVMVRGLDRSQLFYDDGDREEFLRRLGRYAKDGDVELYAWCLMSNHVHLLLREGAGLSLPDFMKRLLLSYSHYFNSRYDRVGYLFQDRYKSKPVEDDAYLLCVLRYILRNPLEAGGNVDTWTSYREVLEGGGLVNGPYVLSLFADDKQRARRAFEDFVTSEAEGRDKREVLGEDSRGHVKDAEAIRAILSIPGVRTCQDVCDLPREERGRALHDLRSRGLSIRQISRLTGLSKGAIARASGQVGTEARP